MREKERGYFTAWVPFAIMMWMAENIRWLTRPPCLVEAGCLVESKQVGAKVGAV